MKLLWIIISYLSVINLLLFNHWAVHTIVIEIDYILLVRPIIQTWPYNILFHVCHFGSVTTSFCGTEARLGLTAPPTPRPHCYNLFISYTETSRTCLDSRLRYFVKETCDCWRLVEDSELWENRNIICSSFTKLWVLQPVNHMGTIYEANYWKPWVIFMCTSCKTII